MTTRPIADGIFTTGAGPRLLGGRHIETGRIVFPCPDGQEGTHFARVPLSPRGTLWSWTVQRFRPKSPPYAGPAAFEPFALGYVELKGETIVQSRLVGLPLDGWQVGMELALTLVPFATDPDGTVVQTYAFQPTGGASS